MRLPGRNPVVRDAPLARLNPIAKLGAALLPALALLVSVDLVSAGIVLTVTMATVPFWGIGWSVLMRRTWPLAFAIVMVTAGNAMFTDRKAGAALIDVGPVLITSDSVLIGFAAGIRVAAIALPGVLAVMTIDPVDLADSLVRYLRVPSRFAYGWLAAFRLVPIMAAEWDMLGRARRARGFGGDHNPVTAARVLASRVFALLVGAVRRGARLAVAMDARGFDSAGERTTARQPPIGGRDLALLGGSAAATTAAVTLAVVTGSWNLVLS